MEDNPEIVKRLLTIDDPIQLRLAVDYTYLSEVKNNDPNGKGNFALIMSKSRWKWSKKDSRSASISLLHSEVLFQIWDFGDTFLFSNFANFETQKSSKWHNFTQKNTQFFNFLIL